MKRASAPSYDLFKLAVTIVLLVILLLMLLRGCATISAAPIPTDANTSSPVPTEAIQASSTPENLTPSSTPTALQATTTPTTIASTPSATSAATESPTTAFGTATPSSAQNVSCNTSVPSRLNVGQTAQVVQRLNMRDDASIDAAIIQTNPTGTQIEIIGGPVCTPVGDRAYLWWQIRLPDGVEGWSAESPLNDATYLLEPVP
jgi:cytoskeletal protein RodZ